MDVIEERNVSIYSSGKDSKVLRLCFDSGSYREFIKKTIANNLGVAFKLPEPQIFYGLGGGSFKSSEISHIYVNIKGIWCSLIPYVVDDEILEPQYDILIGHGFMQSLGISLDMENGRIKVDEERLRLSQRIR